METEDKQDGIFTDDIFNTAVNNALVNEEMLAYFDQAGGNKEYYHKKLLQQKSDIYHQVGKQIEELVEVNAELETAEITARNIEISRPPKPGGLFFSERAFTVMFLMLIGILTYGNKGGTENIGFINTLTDLLRWETGVAILSLGAGLFIWYVRRVIRLRRWVLNEYPAIVKLNEKGLRATRDKLLEELNITIQELTNGALRMLLVDTIQISESTTLGITDAPGLSQSFDEHYKINTDAKMALDRMLVLMEGGSIGITGPRGSGKSTLMASFCDTGRWNLERPPALPKAVLSLMTYAPVQYEARDFILHLFASLCNRVHEISDIKPPTDEDTGLSKNVASFEKYIQKYTSYYIITIIGSLLMIAGLIIGAILIMGNVSTSVEITKFSSTLVTVLQVLGLTPGLLIGSGFVIIFASHIFRKFNRPEIYKQTKTEHEYRDLNQTSGDYLYDKASEHLARIKFQESYTSGWSGTLKLPVGAESKLDRSVSRNFKPMSLPEIVSSFRHWVDELHSDYEIIIGIDELDKMESDEMAQRFMNEIKVLFGQAGCFYLISVSQSAMSDFERRGLPFRNVFDSSFDDILNVDYLSFKHAKELIQKRVIGLPVPFVGLSYCMSGGLPRDLIRTCRNLVEIPRIADNNLGISSICSHLIADDREHKLRAVEIEIRNLPITDLTTGLLSKIHTLKSNKVEPQLMSDDAADILGMNVTTATLNVTDEMLVASRKLEALRIELGVYILFSATIVAIFTDAMDWKYWSDDKLEEIAQVRQKFSINIGLTQQILNKVRLKHGLQDV